MQLFLGAPTMLLLAPLLLAAHCCAAETDEQLLTRLGCTTDAGGFARKVDFEELKLSDDEFRRAMAAMVRLKTIAEISFDKTAVPPFFFEELPKLRDVTTIEFRRIDLDAAHLQAAAKLPKLTGLSFYSCRIKGDLFAELGKCKTLKYLFIVGYDDLPRDVFTPLAQLQHLEWFTIRDAPRLDDTGLAALRHYPKLKFFQLVDTSVSDEIFPTIANLTTLEHLSISGKNITQPQLEAFRATHPKMEIWPKAR